MRRLWLILLAVCSTAVVVPGVLAHAQLRSAVPAPGSTVASLTEIELVFSEPIGAESQIELLQDFVTVAELQPVIDPNDATVLRTAVPSLTDGVYTVQWSVSSADGHTISGSYSLGINRTVQSAAPWYQTIWAQFGFLLSGLGVTAYVLRRWRRQENEAAQLDKIPEERM